MHVLRERWLRLSKNTNTRTFRYSLRNRMNIPVTQNQAHGSRTVPRNLNNYCIARKPSKRFLYDSETGTRYLTTQIRTTKQINSSIHKFPVPKASKAAQTLNLLSHNHSDFVWF
jgi:hypothetical protein